MNKPFAIIAGEPNSISSEIIFKSWKLRKHYIHKPYFIIGSIQLLELQKNKLNYKIKIKKINNNFKIKDLRSGELPVYDIKCNQKKPFEKISNKSNKYIFKCFESAISFTKNKKIWGFINCPVSKETLFEKKHQGITEFLSKKLAKKTNGVMLIYNKKLSVSPITTHIPLKQVSNKLNKSKIINNVKIINKFYKKFFNKKPSFAILGVTRMRVVSQHNNDVNITSCDLGIWYPIYSQPWFGATEDYSIVVNGGLISGTYLWSNGQITDSIGGLAPGTYTVQVTDPVGCISIATQETRQLLHSQ